MQPSNLRKHLLHFSGLSLVYMRVGLLKFEKRLHRNIITSIVRSYRNEKNFVCEIVKKKKIAATINTNRVLIKFRIFNWMEFGDYIEVPYILRIVLPFEKLDKSYEVNDIIDLVGKLLDDDEWIHSLINLICEEHKDCNNTFTSLARELLASLPRNETDNCKVVFMDFYNIMKYRTEIRTKRGLLSNLMLKKQVMGLADLYNDWLSRDPSCFEHTVGIDFAYDEDEVLFLSLIHI